MKILFKILFFPVRLLWRATAPRRFPHGRPFDMRHPLVIDGDTLHHDGRKIRIWGIDAPEMGEAGGAAAKGRLESLLSRRQVHAVPRDTDVYGRIVAQLFCGRGDIGQAMVASGYAISRNRAYDRDEKRARKAKAGLWKRGGIADPAIHRRAAA
ncbi:thermonuclease family protein [Defluviimonas salinarum]|uniref:Thermonuclease family protein n=1 Tax=Defluviimonas salinarum TaxID=2992147 RepID=A0ABT3J5R1_9RHOB|nr:thermonuclease family protein [Defluviimonas salinarum]MCW3782997.1 thermonuclease family protein [Defluviimonas salinarum]